MRSSAKDSGVSRRTTHKSLAFVLSCGSYHLSTTTARRTPASRHGFPCSNSPGERVSAGSRCYWGHIPSQSAREAPAHAIQPLRPARDSRKSLRSPDARVTFAELAIRPSSYAPMVLLDHGQSLQVPRMASAPNTHASWLATNST